VKKICTTTLTV